MCTGPQHSNGRHIPLALNNGCNSSNNVTISPLAAAAIAGEAVAGDAATRACLISREHTWQRQTNKAPSKQVDSATSSNSNTKEIPRAEIPSSHQRWRTSIKGLFQQTSPTVGRMDMR